LRNEERRREEERRMREEQDRAYREAMNRDKHRIEKKIREEEEKKRIAEEELLAAQLRIVAEKEAQEKQRKWEEQRMLWRRYMRKVMKQKEAHGTSGDQVRIGVRLPDGQRIIRKFDSDDSVSSLYACVDSHFIPEDLDPATDPSSPPSSSVEGKLALHALHDEIARQEGDSHKWWGFMLVSSYPRKEVPWDKGAKIGDIGCLHGGGQLVVEMVANGNGNHKVRKSLENAGDSDEYDTESDEE
jgi:FAS-associated factor 2